MGTPAKPDTDVLAKSIARSRRFYDRVWIALTLVCVLVGTVVWLFTRNTEHLLAGLICVTFPFMGLIYNHLFLFNPWRSPAATKVRLEKLAVKQRKNARTVGYVNGTMLILFSPIIFVLGVSGGNAEYGVLGVIVGGLAGVFCFLVGLAMVIWARRSKLQDSGRR